MIGFLINATLRNVYFNPQYQLLFFRKEIYLLEWLYFSEYDIRMSLYVFRWARYHELSTDANSGELAKAIQNAYSRVKGDLSVQKLGISYQS